MNDFFLEHVGPISIIATLLAAFFVVMAFLRHLGLKRVRHQLDRDDNKPYRVSNPYSATAAPIATPPPTLAATTAVPDAASDPSGKIFRQYGPAPAALPDKPAAPSSGYVWE